MPKCCWSREHFNLVNNEGNTWSCKHCGSHYKDNVTRFKNHLKKCKGLPIQVKAEIFCGRNRRSRSIESPSSEFQKSSWFDAGEGPSTAFHNNNRLSHSELGAIVDLQSPKNVHDVYSLLLNNHKETIEHVNNAIPEELTLSDITTERLEQLGKSTDLEHLSAGTFEGAPSFPVGGLIYGPNNRLMVCLNCQRAHKPHAPVVRVWFVVHTAANGTFLSEATVRALSDSDTVPPMIWVGIQDQNCVVECSVSRGQFAEANVLGMAAIRQMNASIGNINWATQTWTLVKQ